MSKSAGRKPPQFEGFKERSKPVARKLKVFGGMLDGRRRTIVAATNMNEAARLWGVSRHYVSRYATETFNKEELALALGSPGTVFVAHGHNGYGDYKPEK